MTFAFAVGILGRVNISWPAAAQKHHIFFILSLSLSRYIGTMRVSSMMFFPSSSTNMSTTFHLLLYPIRTGTGHGGGILGRVVDK